MFILILSVAMIVSGMPICAETTKGIVISSVSVEAGEESEVSVTINGFDDLVGAYYLELNFPDFVSINSVFRDGTELTKETDYNIWRDNILIICEYIGYEDSSCFQNSTVLTVKFKSNSAVDIQEDITITSESNIVYDEDLNKVELAAITKTGSIKSTVSNYLKADINQDGSADSIDLILFRKKLLEMNIPDTFNDEIADINGDSNVNSVDLVALKKYLVRQVVYLSDNGDDGNEGNLKDAPVSSLERAIEQVYEDGTILITDTFTVPADWTNHIKNITLTGGIFDASNLSELSIGDNVTFSDITISCKSGANIYANGHNVIVSDNVTVIGNPSIFGGGKYDVDSTNIEIYSGSYKNIYGGGDGRNVFGDTNILIGGTVNSNIDESNHSLDVYIIGGSKNATVEGDTHITLCGDAKAVYIYGGGYGEDSRINGNTNVNINGGSYMSAYAGSLAGHCKNTNITMTKGTIEQLFGGCHKTSMTGDTLVNFIGGTVTRRIYGGCYNEAEMDFLTPVYATDYYVYGNTTVLIGANANYTATGKIECAISAGSRHKTNHTEENAVLKFENTSLYNTLKRYIGNSLLEVDGYDSLYISNILQ